METQLKDALKAIRRLGVKARVNVPGCCRGCVDLKVEDDAPVFWHYGGQGNRIIWDEIDWSDTDNAIWFNHNGLANEDGVTELGRGVIKAITDAGLALEWEDFSEWRCIKVTPAVAI